MKSFLYILNITLLLSICSLSYGQEEFGFISGKIVDDLRRPIADVNIATVDKQHGTSSLNTGKYKLKLAANIEHTVVFSHIKYFGEAIKVTLQPGETQEFNISLKELSTMLPEFVVEDKQVRMENITRVPTQAATLIPSLTGGIESVLLTYAHGVSGQGGELSSQYSVRGGNFDENLVYVNGIEVYRPMLIRAGQQEGLSFANPDMVSSIFFSSGGFDAKYGDKMSSVLDIKYKKPTDTVLGGGVTISGLGGSVYLEGCSKDRNFTHISGARYKSGQYILNSLDTKGDYKPTFADFQTYMTYDVTDKLELSFLGNFSQNSYLFVPEDRETNFGTINEALKLNIYFDGQELDRFTTLMGAVSANYKPNKLKKLTFTASAYKASEEETFDILGQYYLNELDKQLGSDNLGDSISNIGVGSYLNHARNYLDATVANLSHNGYYKFEDVSNKIEWGAKYQHEYIVNKATEWNLLDSAGYSIPYNDSIVGMSEYMYTDANIHSNRVTAYLMDTYVFELDSSDIKVTGGIRTHYWDYSNEFLVSGRASIAFIPKKNQDFVFRFSAGNYYQPAFYKELKDEHGNINPNIKAQRSHHFVLGCDYSFEAWDRRFKFLSEVYYKQLSNIIPYNVDNVRIRYLGNNNASGNAMGLDMKVYGEFIKGIDSWVNLSVMQIQEDIEGDGHGYIPRPTDQRVNFGMFFQDYLPNNPSFKMQLNLLFSTGLPFGPPKGERYQSTHRMPFYRRVDIGFSKVLKTEEKVLTDRNIFRHFKSIWLTAEVFNLLDINNTISYTWVEDIYGRQYGVPNYLTSRRLNIKLVTKF